MDQMHSQLNKQYLCSGSCFQLEAITPLIKNVVNNGNIYNMCHEG